MNKRAKLIIVIITLTSEDIGCLSFMFFCDWQVNCHRAINAVSTNGISYFCIIWKVVFIRCLIILVSLLKVFGKLKSTLFSFFMQIKIALSSEGFLTINADR